MEPPPLPTRSTSWWDRNWKWAVAVLIALSLGAAVAFVFGLLAVLRSSDAYQGALTRARASNEVIAALGSPVEDRLWFTGNIQRTNESGRADLAIPLRGPKGDAVLHVAATRDEAGWHYRRLLVHVAATGANIDLSEAAPIERPSRR